VVFYLSFFFLYLQHLLPSIALPYEEQSVHNILTLSKPAASITIITIIIH